MQSQSVSLSHRPTLAMPLFDNQQAEQIARVKLTIADYVLEFFESKNVGDQFHDADLWKFVNAQHRCAPASPRRIMALLAKEGRFKYELVSRSDSLFKIVELPKQEAA